jgi:Protein of unknown function (DUF3106)
VTLGQTTIASGCASLRLHLLGALLFVGFVGIAGLTPMSLAQTPPRALAGASTTPPTAKPQGPAWSALAPAHKEVLAPLQRDWASIDADRKAKWIEVASRFPAMSPLDRQRVQERMAEWSRMTPSERGQARLQFQEAKQLSPEDRQARWDAYSSLPEAQRRELAQRAKPVAAASATNGAAKPAPATRADSPKTAGLSEKRNLVPSGNGAPSKAVSPTVVQAKPGATTNLVTRLAPAPNHQQAGLPKIAATEGFVNPSTLLPKRGAQGAAVRSTAAPPASDAPP